MSKFIQVEHDLSEVVRVKGFDETATVICIYVQWQGNSYLVIFKDGDTRQCVPEELEPIDKE